jgi:hypothetical protein
LADHRKKLRVSVNYDRLASFAVKRFGSLRAMATQTGVTERTLYKTKENGFISLESAVEVCLVSGASIEDVFGHQTSMLKNLSWMFPSDEPTFIL